MIRRKNGASRRLALLLSIAAGIVSGGVADAQNFPTAAGDTQLPALQAILAADGSVNVIIGLNLSFQPMGDLSSDAQAAQTLAIANAQNDLLDAHVGHNIQNVKLFKNIPYMAMTVDSAALDALVANPLVSTIEEDVSVPLALMENSP